MKRPTFLTWDQLKVGSLTMSMAVPAWYSNHMKPIDAFTLPYIVSSTERLKTALDGNMAEAVLQAAARRGDRALFERLLAAVAKTADRRDRRLLYVALGSFQDPGISASALALILDPAHDYREVVQIAWTLAETPRGSALAYDFMKANFDALVGRAPRDAAAIYPRFAGGFCNEAQRAEVENFFRERTPKYTGGPRILAQTLERIGLCAAFKQKQQASLSRFLKRYP